MVDQVVLDQNFSPGIQNDAINSEEQKQLNDVLQESIGEMVDCTGVADSRPPVAVNGVLQQILPLLNSQSAMSMDPSDMHAKAVILGKLISTNAQKISQICIKETPVISRLADVGNQIEKMNGQSANEILDEEDQVLATEVANRIHEAVQDNIDRTRQELVPCIDAFGESDMKI